MKFQANKLPCNLKKENGDWSLTWSLPCVVEKLPFFFFNFFSYGERQFTNSKRPDLMFSGAQLLVIFNISKN